MKEAGINARVVSLPSWEVFDAQPPEYRNEVLPPEIRARVSIEAGSPLGWERYVGYEGIVIGLNRFGASAPQNVIYQNLGITSEAVIDAARRLVNAGKA